MNILGFFFLHYLQSFFGHNGPYVKVVRLLWVPFGIRRRVNPGAATGVPPDDAPKAPSKHVHTAIAVTSDIAEGADSASPEGKKVVLHGSVRL